MKEKILELKKEITELSDAYEWLTTKKRKLLEDLKNEYEKISKNINEEDLKWIDQNYAKWYENYLHIETVGSIRLPEG